MKIKAVLVVLIISAFLVELHPQVATLDATFGLNSESGIYIPVQNGMPVPSFEKQNRTTISLGGVWKKQRFNANDSISLAKRDNAGLNRLISEAQDRYQKNFDDSGWENKNIPGVENTMYTFPKVPEYYEDGVWYRYKFTVPDSVKDKFIKLIFYSVNYVADVWLNGNYLGYHEGGYTPFAFDVSGKIISGGENVVAVRVDNPEWGKRNDIVPFYEVDWFNYTGIIHDVYLEIAEPVSVVRADVITKDELGNLETTVTVLNKNNTSKNVDIKIEVFKANIDSLNLSAEKASELTGNAAQATGSLQANLTVEKDTFNVWRTNIKVENPDLWSPQNPNLYVMKVTLTDNGNTVDEFYTQFGIRTIKRSLDKVLLNNNVVFFTGVARHEDHPVYGRSIPKDVILSDLKLVVATKANMLRTAHYPNHPYTYLLADRLGIAVVEEIPVWWFDSELPWQIQNNDRHIHEQMFKEMVYRDMNRPSIMLWSLCNECLNVPDRKVFIEKMWNELDNKIQDGRLITQSAAADRPGPDDDSQKACDVAGWTMYFGIFHGSTYYAGTANFLLKTKIYNPGKPVLDTEYGYWSGEDEADTLRQVNVLSETFRAFQVYAPINSSGNYNPSGFLMGVTWWCIFDWYSHQHSNGYQSMGLYSMDRKKIKPAAKKLIETYTPYFNKGGLITSVEQNTADEIASKEFRLEQNYPNPFNPTTTIEYTVPTSPFNPSPYQGEGNRERLITLKVFDILGREVTTLVNEEKPAGNYEIEFGGSNISSGMYFYELRAGEYVSTKKMMLIK